MDSNIWFTIINKMGLYLKRNALKLQHVVYKHGNHFLYAFVNFMANE